MPGNPQPPQKAQKFRRDLWKQPPAEFSQCPFWFWNDELDETEICRQLDDFKAHGVEAFVIHPRIGLPPSITWLNQRLFHFMRFAVQEAKKRGMWVVLYDEGMYPSGSSAGMVVARNPAYGVRGLTCEVKGAVSAPDERFPKKQVASVSRTNGETVFIYDQPVDSVVRGLHYLGDRPEVEGPEEEHPAADLLNPEAVQCFIELVYDRFHRELGEFFGNTIVAIFTDEPHPLGRLRTEGVMPGTTGILEHVNAFLGYDFTPHLPALWFDEEKDAERYRRDYDEAIAHRLNETYFRPLYEWCGRHGVALTGHPADPDDYGHLHYFHLPGQDIVWRHIEPFKPSALEGAPSTMAKAAASAAFHDGRRRNINEFAGAYGHELTFFELQWLASWLLIRGCNLLMPHAFYYSVRGRRKDERPTDVGPNSPWWKDYLAWESMTRRLCWVNTEFRPVCHVAILGRDAYLPWAAAKICFENQIDFHYLSEKESKQVKVGNDGSIVYRDATYQVLLAEEENVLSLPDGATVLTGFTLEKLRVLRKQIPEVIGLDSPAPSLRLRHLKNDHGVSLILLFNEGPEVIRRRVDFNAEGRLSALDVYSGREKVWTSGTELELGPSGWAVFLIER